MKSSAAPRATHLAYVDGLRGIAVLAVVIFHTLAGHAAVAHWTMPGIAKLGARGVDLFFVISGFCLARGRARRSPQAGRCCGYVAFLSDRFARIAPPYLVALASCTLLALTPFGYPTVPEPVGITFENTGLRELATDLVLATPGLPVANTSFWTLGIEARWYLVCPLLVALYARSRSAFALLVVVCYATYAFVTPELADVGTLPAFMLGIVAAGVERGGRTYDRVVRVGTMLAFAGACVMQATTMRLDHGLPLWHLAFFGLLLGADGTDLGRMLQARWLCVVGAASYSIYLVHQPTIWWLEAQGVAPLAAALCGLGVGFLFWYVIERPILRLLRDARVADS